MSASRYFAFTLEKYTENQVYIIKDFAKNNDNVMHLIFGYEIALTTGNPQGCFCVKRKSKPLSFKNRIGIKELHIEGCKKVYEANINYCKKSGNISITHN